MMDIFFKVYDKYIKQIYTMKYDEHFFRSHPNYGHEALKSYTLSS